MPAAQDSTDSRRRICVIDRSQRKVTPPDRLADSSSLPPSGCSPGNRFAVIRIPGVQKTHCSPGDRERMLQHRLSVQSGSAQPLDGSTA